jgi:hypothetical protein
MSMELTHSNFEFEGKIKFIAVAQEFGTNEIFLPFHSNSIISVTSFSQ